MANRDNPHGLLPVGRSLHGGPPLVMEMWKPASDGVAIFVHDAVYPVADGQIKAGRSTPGFAGVALNGGALSTLTPHLVIVDPFAIFDIQDNDDTDGIAAADIGLNADIEANAGSATTGLSGHELDESSLATTSTLDLRVLGMVNKPDNALGEHCRVEVLFNRHHFLAGQAGV